MKRLPKSLAAVVLSSCSAPEATLDAGYDAGVPDAGKKTGTPYGDAGCVLPSDFPFDSGFPMLPDFACQCVLAPNLFHCFEEDGPRGCPWQCPPARDRNDGGYEHTADGGLVCLC